MAIARFKIYDPVDGDTAKTNNLVAQLDSLFCRDEKGVGPDGYGYTWEERIDKNYQLLWVCSSDEVIAELKALLDPPEEPTAPISKAGIEIKALLLEKNYKDLKIECIEDISEKEKELSAR
ncbi:MAG: hypothetical protein M0R74_17870 [Dehalococcoidia bacterium]|nr:hypothetical protein [Dehalococcoidia bacterium]